VSAFRCNTAVIEQREVQRMALNIIKLLIPMVEGLSIDGTDPRVAFGSQIRHQCAADEAAGSGDGD